MAARVTHCPGCQAETPADDLFCQDCGAGLSAAGAVRVPEPEHVPEPEPTPSICPGCGAVHDRRSKFCGACGQSVAVTPQKVPAAVSRRTLFDSALVQQSVNPGDQRPSAGPATHSYSRPLVDLSIGLLLVTFFGMLVWWLIDSQQAKSPFSFKESLIQARGAVEANRLDEGIYILEKISMSKSGDLSPEERAALDDALYLRARTNADKGNHRLALSDLLRVSPGFMNYEDARKKIKELSGLAQSEVQELADQAKSHLAERASVGSPPKQAVDAKPTVPTTSPGKAATKASAVDTTGSVPSPGQNADSDVAQYNKLLADYFSTERMNTRKSIKDGLGVSVDNGEPPSFKEWIESGRPDF